MNNNKKLRLQDMAQRLQVSTATISNAFNRPDQLSDALRRHILEECRRAGYDGPRNGRRRILAKNPLVVLVLPGDLAGIATDAAQQDFVLGFTEALNDRNCALLLLSARDGQAIGRYEALAESFVFLGVTPSAEVVERLGLLRKRVLTLDPASQGEPSRQLGQLAAQRLPALAEDSGP